MKRKRVTIVSVLLCVLFLAGCSGSKSVTDVSAHKKINALYKELQQVKSSIDSLTTDPNVPVSRSDLEIVVKEIKKINAQIEALNVRQTNLTEEIKRLKSEDMALQQNLEAIDSLQALILDEIQSLKTKVDNISASPTSTTLLTPEEYQKEYVEALSYFQNKQYEKAIQKFSELLKSNQNHELADNAQYWLAESYYMLGNYKKALIEFEKVFTFTDKGKYDDAQLKLGYCYLKLGQKEKAIEEFQRLVTYYPSSEYFQKAQEMLNQLQ
ncbi:MAG: tetratricopeptide repeat protein [Candidatus Marinimicrobia bacterium]|nr:tetratricopeptide repeat protein [Candidatus Neomarinimicrobiota bacterium]MDD5582398.1 tetratricopeptide repeat protein [Candidatus Neomarinimicrobiota bacterium]